MPDRWIEQGAFFVGDGVSAHTSVHVFKDASGFSRSLFPYLPLGLSFAGDLPLASFFKSLISRRSSAMMLSQSWVRDPDEDGKFNVH